MPDNIKDTLSARGIALIIPTYNNSGTILSVVKQSLEYCDSVIVVNDGSTDNTSELLSGVSSCITLIEYRDNKGKGYALKRGFRKALEMGYSYAITMDADGQHLPSEIPSLLRANMEYPGSVIIGKRKGLENVKRTRGSAFANSFSNFWFSFQTWKHVSDTQTGFRLYPIKKLRFLKLVTNKYEAELELLVLMAWHGVKIVETEVEVFYPAPQERVSSYRPVMDFIRISIMNLVLTTISVVYGWPMMAAGRIMTFLRGVYTLAAFLVFSLLYLIPYVYCLVHIGRMTEEKRQRIRLKLTEFARFAIFRHGLPGAPATFENRYSEDFSKSAVIISNHQSHLDLMLILSLTENQVLLTNDWVWNNPFYGSAIHAAEYLPVSEGMETMLPKLKSLRERGISVMVFPEGTRSQDCSIERFHKGAFAIADMLDLDILPVVIYGAGKVVTKHRKRMNRWKIHFTVEKRISAEEYRAIGSQKEIASHFRKFYKQRYEEIQNRIEQDI